MADTLPSNPLAEIAARFTLPGPAENIHRHGSGHINDTYALTAGGVRFVLQRINRAVFKDPEAVMNNVARVTAHLQRRRAGHPDAARRVLRLVPTGEGAAYGRDAEGEYWRCYHFIEGARTHDALTHPRQAWQAAAAFGAFQRDLRDLPAPRLQETIPHFHDTVQRYLALVRAVAEDRVGRSRACQADIDFALSRESLAGALQARQAAGLLPERVTHNDTKLNNVFLDDVTGEGVCVVDLDTTMPGLAVHDFGDMVRTSVSPAAEDEVDLAQVTVRVAFYRALREGYLSTAGEFLTAEERVCLALGGIVIAYEQGMRFLTDYLNGDLYYRVHRPDHNLIRCRTQFRLVDALERCQADLERH